MVNCNSENINYMKQLRIFSFLVIGVITAQSQSLLLKKNPERFYKYDPGKYFDKKEYKLLAPPKKIGTFIFTGQPLRATSLLQNLNGNFVSLPIEGIFVTTPKIQTFLPDTIKPLAKLLYNTDKGKVYALPIDNMPCLVPHTNSNMPIAKINIENFKKIPNAFPKQNLIPNRYSINPPVNNDK